MRIMFTANISRAPFDITDICTVNICEFREPLLGKGTLQAKLPNSLSEGELRGCLAVATSRAGC